MNIELGGSADYSLTWKQAVPSASVHTITRLHINQPAVAFTITADGTTNNLNDVTVNINYYYHSASSDNIYPPVLTAADDSSLNFTAAIAVQECSLTGDNFAGGSSDDGSANNPWQIDNDIRLDLMSRLVNDTTTYTAYSDDHYSLTANINMGVPEAPWAEGSLHPNANINGFIPIGKTTDASGTAIANQINRFRGQLGCAVSAYTISNLYISNTNSDEGGGYGGWYIGLFGVLTNGAVITNCTLSNVNIMGYQYVGGLAGYIHASNASGSNTILGGNAIIGVSISATKDSAGGIAGYMYAAGSSTGTMLNSNRISGASISGKYHAGGIAGKLISSNNGSSSNAITGGSITV